MKIAMPFVIAASLLVLRADAQAPPANAALRYWMAFAAMRDPPADKATADLLERVSEGRDPWDEAKLGRIVDDNQQALAIMQRASTLTFCDWGLEYDLGPDTAIPHLAKARTLGRLAVIAGKRLQAQGQLSQAVDMWLAGVRFSRHIAEGGSLISALSGRRVMQSNLWAIHRENLLKSLDEATRKRIETVVRALPEAGFDWSAAMKREEAAIEVTVRRLQAAPDPKAYFARMTQSPAPADFTPPSAADVAAFHAFMGRIQTVLATPPGQWRDRLEELERTQATLHPFFQRFVVHPKSLEGASGDLAPRRYSLLEAVTRP
jgi:hypothetical protein